MEQFCEPSDLSMFTYDEARVRVTVMNSEPWFVAKDVCDVLQHRSPSQAVSRLDEDEKGITTVITPGGPQQMGIVSESGLYSLILTSRKPQAKAFKRWVTRSVLPQIRRTGHYVPQRQTLPQTYLEALEALVASEREKQRMTERVQTLVPKARAYDRLLSGDHAQTVEQVGKSFGLGRNRMFALLREHRVLRKNNLPYQQYLERGYFRVRQVPTTRKSEIVHVAQTLVTPQGIEFIGRLLDSAALRMSI